MHACMRVCPGDTDSVCSARSRLSVVSKAQAVAFKDNFAWSSPEEVEAAVYQARHAPE